MPVFVACLVDRDLSKLILTGQPTEHDLALAWRHLYSEYLERIKDGNIEAFMDRQKRIDELTCKLGRLQCLLCWASKVAAEEIAAAFAKDGFKLDINAPQDEYVQQLAIINAKLKPDSMRLDSLLAEQAARGEKGDVTHGTFTTIMWDIAQHEGYRVRLEDVTVGEYCAAFCRLRDHREAQARAAQTQ